MRRMIRYSALALTAVIVALSPGSLDAQEETFVGAWTLNADESDNMEDVMSRDRNTDSGARSTRRSGSVRRRVGNLDSGGESSGSGPAPSEEQQRQARLLTQRFRQMTNGFEIAQSDSTVTLVFANESRVFFTDGRKVESVVGDGVEIEVKAELKGDKFKIETKTKGNAKLTQEFKMDDERMVLEIKLQNSRMNQNYRAKLVFDPAT